MQGRCRITGLIVAAVLFACVPTLGGCKPPPPALTKAELDAVKLPDKHPKVTATPEKGCRGCHREQPAIKTK